MEVYRNSFGLFFFLLHKLSNFTPQALSLSSKKDRVFDSEFSQIPLVIEGKAVSSSLWIFNDIILFGIWAFVVFIFIIWVSIALWKFKLLIIPGLLAINCHNWLFFEAVTQNPNYLIRLRLQVY